VIPEEDAVQIKLDIGVMDYFSRVVKGNLVYIAGNDVTCREEDVNADGVADLVMENSFLRVAFKKTTRTSPMAGINTSASIMQLTEKTGGATINMINSSIIIDNNQATSSGTGYSEILKTGSDLPVCTVHFFVNSTVSYDVFYRLYAGADFITAEARNIR
jgi:hypothetical protein